MELRKILKKSEKSEKNEERKENKSNKPVIEEVIKKKLNDEEVKKCKKILEDIKNILKNEKDEIKIFGCIKIIKDMVGRNKYIDICIGSMFHFIKDAIEKCDIYKKEAEKNLKEIEEFLTNEKIL